MLIHPKLSQIVKEEKLFSYDEPEKKETYSIFSIIQDATLHGRAVCPICKAEKEASGRINYEKRNVEVYDNKTAFCFRCHTKFAEEADKDVIRTRDFEFGEFFNLVGINCEFLDRKREFADPIGVNYVKKRNNYIDDNFIKKYDVICEKNRVILPFYYMGSNFYYQIRFIKTLPDRPKYFNPPIDKKPIYCWEYSPLKDTIVVEGVFDAFALLSVIDLDRYNVVAIIGSFISDYQMGYINSLGGFKKVLIFMDDIGKSYDLAKRFRRKKYRGPIEIIRTFHDTDPEELLNFYGKKGFIDYIDFNREKYKVNYVKSFYF